ncbi:MAG: DUF2520 domain-containing protein [Lachnospiraceae bacterium]|nr:DUF2520 domain-containing protein [Lachnospiraceae bacterium]
MNIGFIGAGRVGVTLGRYFTMQETFNKQHKVIGYYDIDETSSAEAAEYTDSRVYTLEDVVANSDIIFITVVDGAIKTVWDNIIKFNLEGKIVCHCSGALSSEIFSIDKYNVSKEAQISKNSKNRNIYTYSVHPLFACSSKESSYKDISTALFTIEGSKEKLDLIKELVEALGNPVEVIDASAKVKYHAAAVMASNQMIGLIKSATDLLAESGFSKENALMAIKPLIYGNINNVYKQGLKDALTGPVARGDMGTVSKHINALDGSTKEVYQVLTGKLIELVSE